MTEETKDGFTTSIKNQEESTRLTERLFEVVEPDVVFSKPKKVGEYTMITASEINVGVGSGYGFGSGSYTPPADEQDPEDEEQGYGSGSGGGGGGGGMSSARPVAVIIAGPDGVVVQPVLDRTKIGIALLTTLGTMFITLSKMRRG